LIFPELLREGLLPFNAKRVYLHGNSIPDVWVDIEDTIDLKIRALLQHKTQVGNGDGLDKMIREWAEETGKPRQLKYAEAYRVMVLEE
jgi:LmbE family N-acetylglucosaminyl deacetylase